MRVLITGGLGYLGGRIAQHFVEQGDYVIVASRQRGLEAPVWLRKNGEVFYFDLENPDFTTIENIDCFIHLAALNEIDCAKSPELALQVNTIGTLRLLECLAKTLKPRRFIYFSTAHVYAAPLLGEVSEQMIPRPVHPYAYSHKAAEDLVFAYQYKAFQEAVVIRLSNGFGYPERASVNRWTLLVNDLCQQIAVTGKLKLNSDGSQPRDFIPLEDVARATRFLTKVERDKLGNGLFNVGSGRSYTVFEMATRVRQCAIQGLGRELPEIERPIPDASKKREHLRFSIEKLLSIGFEPSANWDHEIKNTLSLCVEMHRLRSTIL